MRESGRCTGGLAASRRRTRAVAGHRPARCRLERAGHGGEDPGSARSAGIADRRVAGVAQQAVRGCPCRRSRPSRAGRRVGPGAVDRALAEEAVAPSLRRAAGLDVVLGGGARQAGAEVVEEAGVLAGQAEEAEAVEPLRGDAAGEARPCSTRQSGPQTGRPGRPARAGCRPACRTCAGACVARPAQDVSTTVESPVSQ